MSISQLTSSSVNGIIMKMNAKLLLLHLLLGLSCTSIMYLVSCSHFTAWGCAIMPSPSLFLSFRRHRMVRQEASFKGNNCCYGGLLGSCGYSITPLWWHHYSRQNQSLEEEGARVQVAGTTALAEHEHKHLIPAIVLPAACMTKMCCVLTISILSSYAALVEPADPFRLLY